jgi:hypothetical protein
MPSLDLVIVDTERGLQQTPLERAVATLIRDKDAAALKPAVAAACGRLPPYCTFVNCDKCSQWVLGPSLPVRTFPCFAAACLSHAMLSCHLLH